MYWDGFQRLSSSDRAQWALIQDIYFKHPKRPFVGPEESVMIWKHTDCSEGTRMQASGHFSEQGPGWHFQLSSFKFQKVPDVFRISLPALAALPVALQAN